MTIKHGSSWSLLNGGAARLAYDATFPSNPIFSLLLGGLKELPIPMKSGVNGKAIFELGFPDGFLVILIARANDFMLPSGGIVLQGNDTLLVLSDKESYDKVIEKFKL